MYIKTNKNEKIMLLAEAIATETRQETVSEYKKEDEINKLKEEVNRLLEKIKKFGNIEVKDELFKSAPLVRIKIFSNGDLLLGERYFDEQMGYYKTRMNKTTIDEIPERHKITVLEIQKELMEEVLDKFSNKNLCEK